MPRIFVYEFLSGGGTLADAEPPSPSLLREGKAMAAALATDFAACRGVEVTLLRDHRLPPFASAECHVVEVANAADERRAFRKFAAHSDWTVVIAPESSDILLSRCEAVVVAGGQLLGPGCYLVRLAGDKHATAEYLQAAGVPVPYGIALSPGQALPRDFPYPAVLKPRDGCGSIGVQWIAAAAVAAATVERPSRLEKYCQGVAASVAILSGPRGHVVLPPCRQRLSKDNHFTYLGGSVPLPDDLEPLARGLAEKVIASLPKFTGYIGIDLVLTSASTGYVIEINPRLTTSYVGLRAAAQRNLAAVMLDLAEGKMPALTFTRKRLAFNSRGQVRHAPLRTTTKNKQA